MLDLLQLWGQLEYHHPTSEYSSGLPSSAALLSLPAAHARPGQLWRHLASPTSLYLLLLQPSLRPLHFSGSLWLPLALPTHQQLRLLRPGLRPLCRCLPLRSSFHTLRHSLPLRPASALCALFHIATFTGLDLDFASLSTPAHTALALLASTPPSPSPPPPANIDPDAPHLRRWRLGFHPQQLGRRTKPIHFLRGRDAFPFLGAPFRPSDVFYEECLVCHRPLSFGTGTLPCPVKKRFS